MWIAVSRELTLNYLLCSRPFVHVEMRQWKGDHAEKLIDADKVLVKGSEDNFSCVALRGNGSEKKTLIRKVIDK